MTVTQPYRSTLPAARTGFPQLLHAEWTKFRTVRGWAIGMVVAIGVTVLFGVVSPASTQLQCSGPAGQPCGASTPPLGPAGGAVSDSFYFVRQTLTGNGTITARVTSLTGRYPDLTARPNGQDATPPMLPGVQPWAKTGLIVKAGAQQGSAYAAVALTGRHGVRMQYDYTHDVAAAAGATPGWLRLTRAGATVTGYDSADGVHWSRISSAELAGLPDTVQIGLFTASPDYEVITDTFGGSSGNGGPSVATGVFDSVSVRGAASGTWSGGEFGQSGGSGPAQGPPVGYQRHGGTFSVTGNGDIAPVVAGESHRSKTIENGLIGGFAGLIAVIMVGSMYTTAEYRRGLIRTTFAASPRRVRVLAAKSLVIGAVAFVAGLVASAVSVVLVTQIEHTKGFFVYPVSTATELRVVLGTAALIAVTAVLAMAMGVVLRRGAGAVTSVIVAMVLPYVLAVASVLPSGPAEWLLRITPAAAFAIQQSMPAFFQVTASYTPNAGYYPLAPWAGFAVLCGYTVVALGLAAVLLRRRDA
jgi:ABC-type transport system involved in multi-copper enzyme maturation permease subunit